MERLAPFAFLACFGLLAALWLTEPTAAQAVIEAIGQRQVIYALLGSIIALLIVLDFKRRREDLTHRHRDYVAKIDGAITNLYLPYPEVVKDAAETLADGLEECERIHRFNLWQALRLFAIAGLLGLCFFAVSGTVVIDLIGELP